MHSLNSRLEGFLIVPQEEMEVMRRTASIRSMCDDDSLLAAINVIQSDIDFIRYHTNPNHIKPKK